MSRTKALFAALMVVLAVGAVASSAASAAPQYKIKGTVFTGTENISAALLSAEGVLETKLPGGEKVKITCTALSEVGGKIFKSKEGSATSITFTGCKVVEPKCKLGNSKGEETTTVTTTEVSSLVEEPAAGKFAVKFTPKSGTSFVTVTLLACAGEGPYIVSGFAKANLLTTAEETLKGINFTKTSGSSLKFGTQEATIVGLAGLSLSGTNKGAVWGVS